MLIHYQTTEALYEGILQLTMKGLTFDAYPDKGYIELRGGY